mgnify:CR=1 FL=1
MEILQYILLGVTSALFLSFAVLLIIYFVKGKKLPEDKNKLLEKILLINAISLFVISLGFAIINILMAVGIIK